MVDLLFYVILGLLIAGAVAFARFDDSIHYYDSDITVGDVTITACKHGLYFFIAETGIVTIALLVLAFSIR